MTLVPLQFFALVFVNDDRNRHRGALRVRRRSRRIGLSSFTPINAAVWIAEDKGLFKKHGIDAEVVLIGGASAGGVSSLIAGDVQFLAGAGGAVVG